jgi:hypothetical protein
MAIRVRTVHCPACQQERAAARCPARCGQCDICCKCGSDNLSADGYGHGRNAVRFHGEPTAEFPLFAGAEIEVNGVSRYGVHVTKLVRETWGGNVERDGSCGYEIKPSPARGEAFVKQNTAICTLLTQAKATVDKRCGCHIHVGAHNPDGSVATYAQIRRLAILWSFVERGVYNLCAPSRLSDEQARHYCAPTGDRYLNAITGGTGHPADAFALTETEVKDAIDRCLYGCTGARADAAKASGGGHAARYAALNLHSFLMTSRGRRRGTVEFRLFSGTTDAQKLLGFAMIATGLTHWAMTHTDDEVMALRGTPAEILDRVIPHAAAWRKARQTQLANMKTRRRLGRDRVVAAHVTAARARAAVEAEQVPAPVASRVEANDRQF